MVLAPLSPLPDDALICSGGTCSAERFRQGSGVTLDASGRLVGVSVNCGAVTPIEGLSMAIPNRRTGVTSMGSIRRIEGTVNPAPSANNRFHCILSGITPQQAAQVFSPVVANPNR
jgi:hypothetical protein